MAVAAVLPLARSGGGRSAGASWAASTRVLGLFVLMMTPTPSWTQPQEGPQAEAATPAAQSSGDASNQHSDHHAKVMAALLPLGLQIGKILENPRAGTGQASPTGGFAAAATTESSQLTQNAEATTPSAQSMGDSSSSEGTSYDLLWLWILVAVLGLCLCVSCMGIVVFMWCRQMEASKSKRKGARRSDKGSRRSGSECESLELLPEVPPIMPIDPDSGTALPLMQTVSTVGPTLSQPSRGGGRRVPPPRAMSALMVERMPLNETVKALPQA